jgi:hypothetical protein
MNSSNEPAHIEAPISEIDEAAAARIAGALDVSRVAVRSAGWSGFAVMLTYATD